MSISFDKELFRTRHLGPDPQQVTEMLSAIKADSLQQLMEETIPAQIRLKKPLNLPDALSEEEYLDYLRNEIASKNKIYKSFIGMGYYDRSEERRVGKGGRSRWAEGQGEETTRAERKN